MSNKVTVKVPATTANLGPGFDCIGAALSLYNKFAFSPLTNDSAAVKIAATGKESGRVTTDESNLAYQAFAKLYAQIGKTVPPVLIEIDLEVPLARGLGSSATAIVGGLVGANELAGAPLGETELMELAIAIEGHPDNVVPALLGGCRLAVAAGTEEEKDGSNWAIADIPWHPDIVPVVAIPDFELSTAEARKVLPADYSRAEAIFNTAHLGLLVRALETGRGDWLRVAMRDRIHQPYRQTLIKGYEEVRSAALTAGAWEMVISGAGPTLLALTPPSTAAAVAAAMDDAWKLQGVVPSVKVLEIQSGGVAMG
ncbi:MAG: homoserine kinase [Cyanobacteriota bacterium]|nr:homoserine kinase [Cyanobacteriota bacterium]